MISLQEEPKTQIISLSEDGCSFMQQSEIFYHITNDDADLEIMCELYSSRCGNGRSNASLHISTDIKG